MVVSVRLVSADQTERLKVTFSRRKATNQRADSESRPNTESSGRLSYSRERQ